MISMKGFLLELSGHCHILGELYCKGDLEAAGGIVILFIIILYIKNNEIIDDHYVLTNKNISHFPIGYRIAVTCEFNMEEFRIQM